MKKKEVFPTNSVRLQYNKEIVCVKNMYCIDGVLHVHVRITDKGPHILIATSPTVYSPFLSGMLHARFIPSSQKDSLITLTLD